MPFVATPTATYSTDRFAVVKFHEAQRFLVTKHTTLWIFVTFVVRSADCFRKRPCAANGSESRPYREKIRTLFVGGGPDVDVHVGIAGVAIGMHRAQMLVESAQPQFHHVVVHFLD